MADKEKDITRRVFIHLFHLYSYCYINYIFHMYIYLYKDKVGITKAERGFL